MTTLEFLIEMREQYHTDKEFNQAVQEYLNDKFLTPPNVIGNSVETTFRVVLQNCGY